MGIGRIKGGLARNVIADQCVVDWELRPVVPEDGEFVNEEYGCLCERYSIARDEKSLSKS